ncbi:MAG: hypothetical protein R3285_04045 [Kiloniellales bacterium]|nr:hypothetical protein [Kiloniellales bacterium]
MATCTKDRNRLRSGTKGGHGLLELVRHRSRRLKNLAELRALDSARLQDIGLSEEARARIVG